MDVINAKSDVHKAATLILLIGKGIVVIHDEYDNDDKRGPLSFQKFTKHENVYYILEEK